MKATDSQRGLQLDTLRAVLHYDQESGVFTWTKSCSARSSRFIGRTAGHVGNHGYRGIVVCGHLYIASRLAWFYVTGTWPTGEIDHRDLNKDNNAWHNLREGTSSQNCGNRRVRSDSTCGVKGIRKQGKLWRANINVRGRRISLGYFRNMEDAAAAYAKAAVHYFGSFARAA